MVLNEQLSTLICVAEQGSFGKAAEKLYVTTPAVIKQMNTLEGKLGIRLFDRTNHGVSLTPAADILYREAVFLENRFAKAVDEARRLDNPHRNVLRIGSSIFKPCQPFVELWNRFNGEFPSYSLQILPFDDDHTAITDIVRSLGEKFDFLVAACNSKLWLKHVNFLKLKDCRFCAAVPLKHPLAGKTILSIDDLSGYTVHLFAKGDAASIDVLWDELAHFPDILLRPADYYDIELFNQASQNNEIIISLDIWENVHPSFVSVPMDWNYLTPFGLLYAKKPSAAVEKFIRLLVKEVGEDTV